MNAIVSTINIELTSRCNKSCWMCGRRKLEKLDPNYKDTLGDMDYSLFCDIVGWLPPGVVVQLHWNGEPTLYPHLEKAAKLIKYQGNAIVCMDTNGLLLDQLAGCQSFDSITVSIITNDEWENYAGQLIAIDTFCKANSTLVNLRCLGTPIPSEFFELAKRHNLNIVTRALHSPYMSRDYEKPVTLPEIGVCLDLLHHAAIDRYGNVFPCVRINPQGLNKLGNLREASLGYILNGKRRQRIIDAHFAGKRDQVPLCRDCDF